MADREQTPRERWLALTQDEQDAVNEQKKARGEKPIPTHREWPRVGRMRSVAATFTKPDGSPLIVFNGDEATS